MNKRNFIKNIGFFSIFVPKLITTSWKVKEINGGLIKDSTKKVKLHSYEYLISKKQYNDILDDFDVRNEYIYHEYMLGTS